MKPNQFKISTLSPSISLNLFELFCTSLYNCFILESKVIKDGKYLPLFGGGRLIAGQEQDTLGGSFDETQSLSGSVSGLEVWTGVISPEDIQELATCDVETLDISERIVKWTESEWRTFGNVTTKSQENICQPSPLLNVV